jgi:hypothetical protein
MGRVLTTEKKIIELKEQRVAIDALVKILGEAKSNAEETLAWRALQQAKHWLGESLAIHGSQNPYPNSMDVTNIVVDPTADVAQ